MTAIDLVSPIDGPVHLSCPVLPREAAFDAAARARDARAAWAARPLADRVALPRRAGDIAGNAAILKHAAQTLQVGERLAEAFHEASVPEAVFQNLVPAHVPRMEADDDDGPCLTPQVLTGVTHAMRVLRDETFGPVVGIMPVEGDDEAVACMNDSPFGLTASVWTKGVDAPDAIGDRLETGAVLLDRCDHLDPALWWTGCEDTGRGAGLSVFAYHAPTRPKPYHSRMA